MTGVPSKCKAMVVEKAGEPLVYKDVDVKAPGEGEILVKVLACGACHSDEFVRQGAFGDVFPLIPGHEIIGDCVAIGPREKKWKVGDRVGGGWHGGHDMACKQCNRGQFQMCDNAAINGVTKNGGYSEYCLLRTEAVVGIEKELDPVEAAPLLCAGVTLFNGIRRLGIESGETVAIQGLGGLGHLGLQYCRQMGYRTVALSSSDKKKEFATKLGAHEYISGEADKQAEELQKIGGAALIVVTAPNPKIISPLLNGLSARGKILILAPVGDVPVNTVSMITKGLSVHGWPSGHAIDSEEAVRFAGHHDVKCMVEKFKLSEANEALKKMNAGEIRFRGVLVP